MSPLDISVSFPCAGIIRLRSRSLFGDAENPMCRRFLERVFLAEEISNVTITGGDVPQADLYYCPTTFSVRDIVARVAALLGKGSKSDEARGHGHDARREPSARGERQHAPRATRAGNRRRSGDAVGRCEVNVTPVAGLSPADEDRCTILYYRQDLNVSDWQIKSDLPGRLRVKNPVLFRKNALCQAIERELMGVLGIDRFSTNSLTSTVLVHYDPNELTRAQVIEILDTALAGAEPPAMPDKLDVHLPVCTASLPLAATAQFVAGPLLPAAAALYAYTSIPTFKEARRVFVEDKRIGVDALDAVVMVGCLGTMSIFPGAVCCWCLSFGRFLVKKSRDSSQKLLVNAFGKQPRYVWLCRGGTEVQVSADKLAMGDVIVVHTGEVVPVDGHVIEGMALVDQHALTGESTPAEKGTGDRVFASTLLVAGEIKVTVEMSGSETASAKISQILSDTAGYKMSSQHKGERLADKAVLPTLGVGALGMAMLGPMGAVAVLNSDLGTGIRMAVPLAMLSSLTLCASKGILVKDGRALEMMNQIDTVLFDKTGTLTRERPEVGRIVTAHGFSSERILGFAAAAERKFHHPIALAILQKADEIGLALPPTDETQYKVGYGITVRIDGHIVRVGSKRFLESEGIEMPVPVLAALDIAHLEGHTMVMVGVDDQLGGAIELEAAVRPEVRGIIRGLRERGIKHIAIISGDHEAPTRKLAESLGMDRYFAQVLPADKAEYVAKLQAEGCKVCFVGDGINDSIALKKADVSISLRGASSIATDTAHIVFLEGGLSKLCDLRDIGRDLDRNVNRSWSMIVAPNLTNVVGVFTMGFGIMSSVLTNNVSALFALANGLLPLRKIARAESDRRRDRERVTGAPASRDLVPMPPLAARRRSESVGDQRRLFTESA
jgi:heavy metal translocating P-type ATPase